ncbi:MAG TPA: carboxypeptidase regulatory-like domain-containing protein, partial [Bryobacteraceae bacterium]|nr:carboxypeptidase regulatory-like domain-containing protein [Bryobacteraceae bacterium]
MCITGAAAAILLWQVAAFAGEIAPAGPAVEVTVVDSANLPIAGVRLDLKVGATRIASAETDANGRAVFDHLSAARYSIIASKDGLETLERSDIQVSDSAATAVSLTMAAMARHESINVEETVAPIEQGATVPTRLPPQVARETPIRPATVAEALPLLPGVVRKPDGALQISGSAEHRSALIVNSADVTDPATGQFGLTVPIDSVETLNVFQTPYMAEYGRFTAGLVSVETRRGGEKWKWELNDPFPDFYIRSWKLRGLRDATPRFNAEGPLISGKLYFSEGLEYEVRKTEIY